MAQKIQWNKGDKKRNDGKERINKSKQAVNILQSSIGRMPSGTFLKKDFHYILYVSVVQDFLSPTRNAYKNNKLLVFAVEKKSLVIFCLRIGKYLISSFFFSLLQILVLQCLLPLWPVRQLCCAIDAPKSPFASPSPTPHRGEGFRTC